MSKFILAGKTILNIDHIVSFNDGQFCEKNGVFVYITDDEIFLEGETMFNFADRIAAIQGDLK